MYLQLPSPFYTDRTSQSTTGALLPIKDQSVILTALDSAHLH
jgi:hypothetical protein